MAPKKSMAAISARRLRRRATWLRWSAVASDVALGRNCFATARAASTTSL
jgi:hypothetical protein